MATYLCWLNNRNLQKLRVATQSDNEAVISMLKLDLHIHSRYSEDAQGTPRQIIKVLQKKGIEGMALTDHNTIKGALEALKFQTKEFVVIPGIEVSTTDGHLLALNVTDDIPRDKTVVETVDMILDAGGTPVVPHLFRRMSGIKRPKLEEVQNKIPAMEVFNGCSLTKTNIKTAKVARELKLGGTGGSDAHEPACAGFGYTLVDTTDLSRDAIMTEICNKNTWGEGTTISLQIRRDRMLRSIKQFFQRGFKRI